MPRFTCHSPLLEPIELLLRRISRRALSGQVETRGSAREQDIESSGSALPAGQQAVEARASAREQHLEVLCAGRRPAGLVSHSVDRAESKLGDYLARAAHLEAASVVAFEHLAEELTLHRAPAELIARARAARADEVRHADAMHELALARGGQPVAVRTTAFRPRSMLELALENAVEGCIRETYGALVAAHQATRARDLELRMALRRIAPDEARHASLAHAVHVWAHERLDGEARERVRRAQLAAVFELARECSVAPDPELIEAAGLPATGMACALLGELTKELWLPRDQRAA